MKFLVVLATLLVAAWAIPSTQILGSEWVVFKTKHGKQYANFEEELKKLATFQDNLKTIEEHNKLYEAGKSSFKMGVNQFADLTAEEFKAYVGKFKAQKPKSNLVFQARAGKAVPDVVDWRQSGIISEVKDQGQCGSCWAFSATGSLESALKTATGNLISLSEQQLVDCSGSYGNEGCNGGLMDSAFDYIRDNGIVKESDYPYTALDGTCKFSARNNASQVVTKISDYVDVARGEDNLKAAVAERPVSVAIDAELGLQLYASGVLQDDFCGNTDYDLNHGVLAVGYGTEDGQDYWLVKNSWGDYWGESGYFKLARNAGNQCGISNMASYPVI